MAAHASYTEWNNCAAKGLGRYENYTFNFFTIRCLLHNLGK